MRHTWASWHVQAGTPLHVLQELGGWESVEMVRRYAHLSTDHLAEYVERMSGTLKVVSAEAKSGKVLRFSYVAINGKGPHRCKPLS